MKKLYVVATPIGNMNDISKRALEVLESVDIILCEDTRHSLKLLNYYNIKKRLESYHKFNEENKTKQVLKELEDKDIALITDAGTPCISDPGYILIKEAKEQGIEVIGVGGISALITALSVSGIDPINFTFYGFFPRENKDKRDLIDNIKKSNVKTYIFYESPKRIISTLEYILQNLGNILTSVSKDLTKLHEKNFYGKLDKVLQELKEDEANNLGEYVFIIHKEETEKEEIEISKEALLIDKVIKDNIDLKSAIDILSKEYKNISKKEFYNASLRLKDILKK